RIPPAASIAAAAGRQPDCCSGPNEASGPLNGLNTANTTGLVPVSCPLPPALLLPHAASPVLPITTAPRAAATRIRVLLRTLPTVDRVAAKGTPGRHCSPLDFPWLYAGFSAVWCQSSA